MSKTTLINLTPHDITILRESGAMPLALPASGAVARVTVTTSRERSVEGCVVVTQRAGAVEGLPAAAPGVAYVTSALVRLAVPERTDVLSPGELVRDERGQPTGCRGLVATAPRVESAAWLVLAEYPCDHPQCMGATEIVSVHATESSADEVRGLTGGRAVVRRQVIR